MHLSQGQCSVAHAMSSNYGSRRWHSLLMPFEFRFSKNLLPVDTFDRASWRRCGPMSTPEGQPSQFKQILLAESQLQKKRKCQKPMCIYTPSTTRMKQQRLCAIACTVAVHHSILKCVTSCHTYGINYTGCTATLSNFQLMINRPVLASGSSGS